MEYSLDEIITKLYSKCLEQSARISLLEGIVLNYIKSVDPVKHDSLRKALVDCLPKALEEVVLESELKDEYLNYFSEQTLKKAMEQLGL